MRATATLNPDGLIYPTVHVYLCSRSRQTWDKVLSASQNVFQVVTLLTSTFLTAP